ncbi:hypothetical protein [Trinickia acidisoli]|uniref:hypothetical protein n=1 Tax=Trinickia acidisoli TaxID=2767482 RepID=UPI001A909095|nr:hypothetical protein [Trinickia acidisoli]
MSTTKIMLIRHAEKPTGNIGGVSPDGTADAADLIVQGWQRAGALVGLFDPPAGKGCRAGLATPQHVFASGIGKHSNSLRPQHTITPLSAKLGIEIDTQYLKGDEAKLASAITEVGGVVLVAWEHQNIPAIAAAIFPGGPYPSSWPDPRFDLVWVFDRVSGSNAWAFSQVPQLLLVGDQSSVIAPSGNPD